IVIARDIEVLWRQTRTRELCRQTVRSAQINAISAISCAGWLCPSHPELVPHEPPTAALQDRRASHSASPRFLSSAGRKPVDSASVCADHPSHRAARAASDVIKSDGPCWEHAWRRRRECLEGGEAASGGPWDLRDQRLGVAGTGPVTEHEWSDGVVRRHVVRSAARE